MGPNCKCITCDNGAQHAVCSSCGRYLANQDDEAACNTGECGCKLARSLCWFTWNDGICLEYSIYDKEFGQRMLKILSDNESE